MHSAAGDPGYSPGPGCPIRKSQDQSSFDSSPGLIAAYHVLHRLITPRHPPCTLSSLTTFAVGPRPIDTECRQAALAPQVSVNLAAITLPMRLSNSHAPKAGQPLSACPEAKASSGGHTLSPVRRGLKSVSQSLPLVKYFTLSAADFQEFFRPSRHGTPSQVAPVRGATGFQPVAPQARKPLPPPTGPSSWRRPDSNRRPSGCKPDALPTELRPRLHRGLRTADPAPSRLGPPASPPEQAIRAGVGLAGVEPATSPLSGVRSNQLSYRPLCLPGPPVDRQPGVRMPLCGFQRPSPPRSGRRHTAARPLPTTPDPLRRPILSPPGRGSTHSFRQSRKKT